MSNHDETTDGLERLGAEPGPAPDAAFANRLETDLRLLMVERTQPATRPWWRPALVVAAVVLLVVAGSVGLLSRLADPSAELVMTAAADTEVILPDSTPADGRAGLALPEGTRILVGADGQAVVDGVVLAPGSEAVIADGRLEVLTISPTTSAPVEIASTTSTTSTPDVGAGSNTTETSGRSGGSTTGAPDRSTGSTTSGPSDRTTGSTATDPVDRTTASTTAATSPPSSDGGTVPTTPTRPPTTAPPTSTDRTTTEATRPTQTTASDRSINLVVDAVSDARLRLTWSLAGDGPDVFGFEVQVLRGRRLRTVLVLRDPGATSATIEIQATQVGYRVRAIGIDGGVLATSETVRQP